MYTLFDYQKDGVKYLLNADKCLLCDEQGLGKTVQVINACRSLEGEVVNVLVVCPASLTLMWEKEIREQSEGTVVQLKGVKSAVKLEGNLRFIICSYNFIQKEENVKRLLGLKWHCIVADEAHYIKNWKSKTCKGFVKLTENSNAKVWMLTGTPASRSGQDYYPYLQICRKNEFGNFYQFSNTFCNTERNWFTGGVNYTGVKESMKGALRKAFSEVMLRRLKKDVLKDLPPKLVKTLPVKVDASVVAESLQVDERVIEQCIERGAAISGHVMSVMHSIGMGKVESAIEYCLNVSEPLVVFACHVEVIERIVEGLEPHRKVGVVTGQQTRDEKDLAVRMFQDGELDVIVLNVAAGGVGITLTASSHMLFVELPWSPTLRGQAHARCHRIGAKECVNITELIAVGTIDEQILRSLNEKEKFIKHVMGE